MNNRDLYHKAEYLQNAFIACATNDKYGTVDYEGIRKELLQNQFVKKYLPDFVEKCRKIEQFWTCIKEKFSTYQERRKYVWEKFNRLLSFLEADDVPLDTIVSVSIKENATAYINDGWHKALERRTTDPEGAITTAGTLIEGLP